MQPTFKLITKTGAFQFIWLTTVRDFDPLEHCLKCLVGTRSEEIPPSKGKYPAGFLAEGKIEMGSAEKPDPYAYLCAVIPWQSGILPNMHILMEPDESSEFIHDDANIHVIVTGMRRLEIRPLPTKVQAVLLEEFWRCRNFQAGWQLFPKQRRLFNMAVLSDDA